MANLKKVYRLTRDVTEAECDWFDPGEIYKKGEIVFYKSDLYGCCTPYGTMINKDPTSEFDGCEIPNDALEYIGRFVDDETWDIYTKKR